jgi:hypothetical protein
MGGFFIYVYPFLSAYHFLIESSSPIIPLNFCKKYYLCSKFTSMHIISGHFEVLL